MGFWYCEAVALMVGFPQRCSNLRYSEELEGHMLEMTIFGHLGHVGRSSILLEHVWHPLGYPFNSGLHHCI